nr:immunoglobulin light chain junction region [Macaca mulatta]
DYYCWLYYSGAHIF